MESAADQIDFEQEFAFVQVDLQQGRVAFFELPHHPELVLLEGAALLRDYSAGGWPRVGQVGRVGLVGLVGRQGDTPQLYYNKPPAQAGESVTKPLPYPLSSAAPGSDEDSFPAKSNLALSLPGFSSL